MVVYPRPAVATRNGGILRSAASLPTMRESVSTRTRWRSDHPGVLVYQVGGVGWRRFLVMKLARGGTLADCAQR
jgi:hypothetical protein